MRCMVEDVVRSCRNCQYFRKEKYSHCFRHRVCSRPGELLYLHSAGPYPLRHGSGKRVLLVIVDGFSRLVKLRVAVTASSEVVIAGLQRWIEEVGPICEVQADNAAVLHSRPARAWLKGPDISVRYARAYRAHSNEPVERMIGNVNTRLRELLAFTDRSWTAQVPYVEQLINRSINSTTLYTPDELAFGPRNGDVVDADILTAWRNEALLNVRKVLVRAGIRERQSALVPESEMQKEAEVLWKLPKRKLRGFGKSSGRDLTTSLVRIVQCSETSGSRAQERSDDMCIFISLSPIFGDAG